MADTAGIVKFYSVDDDYWGDGGDGSGKNMLGRILMQVRESLRLAQDLV